MTIKQFKRTNRKSMCFLMNRDFQSTLNQRLDKLLCLTLIQTFILKHFMQRKLNQETSYTNMLQHLIRQRNFLLEVLWGAMIDFTINTKIGILESILLALKTTTNRHNLKSL
jgi:hypothetical protein